MKIKFNINIQVLLFIAKVLLFFAGLAFIALAAYQFNTILGHLAIGIEAMLVAILLNQNE